MGTNTTRKARRSRRTAARGDDARAAFLLWWARVGGLLENLYSEVTRIRQQMKTENSPLRHMFERYDVLQLEIELSNAAAQWASCVPRLDPTGRSDPLAAFVRPPRGPKEKTSA
jgi:hypothetical protein